MNTCLTGRSCCFNEINSASRMVLAVWCIFFHFENFSIPNYSNYVFVMFSSFLINRLISESGLSNVSFTLINIYIWLKIAWPEPKGFNTDSIIHEVIASSNAKVAIELSGEGWYGMCLYAINVDSMMDPKFLSASKKPATLISVEIFNS